MAGILPAIFYISANIFCTADTNHGLNNDLPFSSLMEPSLEIT